MITRIWRWIVAHRAASVAVLVGVPLIGVGLIVYRSGSSSPDDAWSTIEERAKEPAMRACFEEASTWAGRLVAQPNAMGQAIEALGQSSLTLSIAVEQARVAREVASHQGETAAVETAQQKITAQCLATTARQPSGEPTDLARCVHGASQYVRQYGDTVKSSGPLADLVADAAADLGRGSAAFQVFMSEYNTALNAQLTTSAGFVLVGQRLGSIVDLCTSEISGAPTSAGTAEPPEPEPTPIPDPIGSDAQYELSDCPHRPTERIGAVQAAQCFYLAWKNGDRTLAETYGSPEAVVSMFEYPYEGGDDPVFEGCRDGDPASCDYYYEGDPHSVLMQFELGGGPSVGNYVEAVNYYG